MAFLHFEAAQRHVTLLTKAKKSWLIIYLKSNDSIEAAIRTIVIMLERLSFSKGSIVA